MCIADSSNSEVFYCMYILKSYVSISQECMNHKYMGLDVKHDFIVWVLFSSVNESAFISLQRNLECASLQ